MIFKLFYFSVGLIISNVDRDMDKKLSFSLPELKDMFLRKGKILFLYFNMDDILEKQSYKIVNNFCFFNILEPLQSKCE